MPEYRLTCVNNSKLHGNFALFQVPPQAPAPTRLTSVAWLARPAAPGTQVRFSWSTEVGFIWGERGTFGGRSTFTAYQYVPADADRENLIDFTADSFGAPALQNLRTGGAQGSLSIRQLSGTFDFPIHLGIAIGRSPIYTVDFTPNVLSIFTPHCHRCWVVFGNYAVGETIDVEALTNTQVVDFSTTSPSQRVALTPENILQQVAGQQGDPPFC
ncbi:hypothetical protein [Ensifer adhaerens]|uniref:hypothetical protein n=1 Tax=Ensifer adhaerens TaxID=106592 RepID=UPI000CF12F24|nr:hypothetical protein [Ensifer adhaerens]